jgi:hypothetical protein
MERFKAITIILLALCLTVFFGQQGVCSEEDTELFDYGTYWMPLTEGNTKSFRSDTNNPATKEPFEYTQTVTGTEVIKGFEAVKVEVTDSNHPLGNYSVGSYDALLPDLSEWQTTLKRYVAKDPTYGSYYMLSIPFNKIPRYRKAPVVGNFFQISSASTVFAENKNILNQRKIVNRPVDSCIIIVTIVDLGFEDATVPAGTFEDCLKTYTQIALSYAQNPQNNMSVATVTWDAEGVGTVKNELTEMMFANEIDMFPYNTVLSGVVTELISATIDGVSYPQD